MSVIKDMYKKTKLSEEKKAELKSTLVQRFPRYADSMEDKTEVIGMNDNKVHESRGHIKVHSKLRTGAVIAAAAVVAVIGGMKLARDQYIEKALIQPAGQGEDNYTTDREDSVKEDYSPQEGYIEIADKTIRGDTKTIYNSACEAYYDLLEITDDELVLGEEKMITPETIRRSRNTEIVHEDGKCSSLEFAAALDKYVSGSLDEDITQYDFAVDFMFDESGTKVIGINYVYIYLDSEHKSFTSYPMYGANGGITENGITRKFSYDSSCAKKLYDEVDAALAKFSERGESFSFDKINAHDVLEEYDYLKYYTDETDFVVTEEMRFAEELAKDGTMAYQIGIDDHNFVIRFTHDSSGNVNGIEKVFVQIFKDGYDENGKQQSERFVYPDENNRDDMTVTIPDVAGKDPYEASDELTSLGLSPKLYEKYSDTVPVGTVISTEPEAGKESEFGLYVTINISKGPLGQGVILPDVIGKDVNEAVSLLKSLGFNTTIEYITSGVYPKGTVAYTDPEGEVESECAYERGENITLYVSTGK